MELDDYWSPMCTHMSDDEDQKVAKGQACLQELSNVELYPTSWGMQRFMLG